MAAGWILGVLIEKIAFRPIRAAGHMPPLLITIGLSIILKDLAVIVLGAENRPVPSVYETDHSGGRRRGLRPPVRHPRAGRRHRAGAAAASEGHQDRTRHAGHGPGPRGGLSHGRERRSGLQHRVCAWPRRWAARRAYWSASTTTPSPAMGGTAGLKGFAACIFGGLTSIPGAILGGLIIGVVENLTVQYIASGYRDMVGLRGDGGGAHRAPAGTPGQEAADGLAFTMRDPSPHPHPTLSLPGGRGTPSLSRQAEDSESLAPGGGEGRVRGSPG